MSIFFSLFYYDNNLDSESLLARKNSIIYFLFFVLKLFLAVFIRFNFINQIVTLILILIISLLILFVLYKYSPIYSRIILSQYIIQYVYVITINISLIISIILNQFVSINGLYILIVLIIFSSTIVYNKSNKILFNYNIINIDSNKSGNLDVIYNYLIFLYKKINILSDRTNKSDMISLLKILEDINLMIEYYHIDSCYKINLKKFIDNEFDNIKIYINNCCAVLLKELCSLYPKNNDILLLWISFLSHQLKNNKELLYNIIKFQEKKKSLTIDILIIRYKIECEDNLRELFLFTNNNNDEELKKMISNQNDITELIGLIEKITKLKLDLMNHLLGNESNIIEIYSKSVCFSKLINKLTFKMNIAKQKNLIDLKFLYLYKKFSTEVLSINNKKDKYFDIMNNFINKKLNNYNQQLNEDSVSHNIGCLALISYSDKIDFYFKKININYSITLGYDPNELKNMPISLIMPVIYESIYSSIKQEYIDKIDNKEFGKDYFGSSRNIFLKNKSNFIIPVSSTILPIEVLNINISTGVYIHNVKYQSVKSTNIHFLVDSSYLTQDYSSNASVYLKDLIDDIKSFKTDMEYIERRFPVDLRYRSGKYKREIIYDEKTVNAICEVFPFRNSIIKEENDKKSNYLYSSINFHVKYQIINPILDEYICRRYSISYKNSNKKKSIKENKIIWKHINDIYYLKNNSAILGSNINKLDLDNIKEFINNDNLLKSNIEKYETGIIVKKIKNKKVIEINSDIHEFEQPSLNNSESENNKIYENSIFKENIIISNLNKKTGSARNQKKIIGKLIKKFKNNSDSLKLLILNIILSIAFIIIIIYLFILFYNSFNYITNNLSNFVNFNKIFLYKMECLSYVKTLELYYKYQVGDISTINNINDIKNKKLTSLSNLFLLYFSQDNTILNNKVYETYPSKIYLSTYDNLKPLNNVINVESNKFYNSLIDSSKSINTSNNIIDFSKINDFSLESSSLNSVDLLV